MPTLHLSSRPGGVLAADALVLASAPTAAGAELVQGPLLAPDVVAHLNAALSSLEATGALGEVLRVASVPGVRAATVAIAGLGDQPTREALRRATANAIRALRTKSTIAVALPTDSVADLAAVADGAHAGAYAYAKLTSITDLDGAARRSPKITLTTQNGSGAVAKSAIARAQIVGRHRDWARDLVNLPPNLLYPQSFADAVKARTREVSGKVRVTVLDDKALARGGFGGIVGVGQGSSHAPRLVVMTWTPTKPAVSVALVGKGITFDSGGLNLKPSASMTTMKCDMAGAAAVAAAVLAAADLCLPVAVTGYLCLAENLPGGSAQRPGDVVTMRNGTTVEILDTDAEGRMVLGDGLALAAEKDPDAIVDVATLTGAQTIALGTQIAAVMGNDDSLRDRVVASAALAGEPIWPMPLPPELRAGLDSANADLAHKADRAGGMLTAGLFLESFVPNGTPWAHLDIAGPAFNEKVACGVTPKGGTGYGVATLVSLLEQFTG